MSPSHGDFVPRWSSGGGPPVPACDQEPCPCPHTVPRPRWPLPGTVPWVGDKCQHLLGHCWSHPARGVWGCRWGTRDTVSQPVTCRFGLVPEEPAWWGHCDAGGDTVTLPSPCASRRASVSPSGWAGGDKVAGGWQTGTCTAHVTPLLGHRVTGTPDVTLPMATSWGDPEVSPEHGLGWRWHGKLPMVGTGATGLGDSVHRWWGPMGTWWSLLGSRWVLVAAMGTIGDLAGGSGGDSEAAGRGQGGRG